MLGANDTMDVVFATHWIYPSRTPVLQPNDKSCVDAALQQRTGAQPNGLCFDKIICVSGEPLWFSG
jgi:hypothetical protein